MPSTSAGPYPAVRLAGRLAMRGVCFTHPEQTRDRTEDGERRPTLADIGFEVPPGQVLALVGFPGAGKSTIARLVARVYDPDEGSVLVDDGDVRDLPLDTLHSHISEVLGDTELLDGTVAENIAAAVPEVTQQRIEKAARDANAHAFIRTLPEGYQTRLGPRGVNLSRSQRQRLAIARAFVRDTPILILDEPTAGLDVGSAWLVDAALHRLMRGRTTILISRDLGLIRSAARILVVSDGRIVERGTHEKLLASGRTYADLYLNHLTYGVRQDRDIAETAGTARVGETGPAGGGDLPSGETTNAPTELPAPGPDPAPEPPAVVLEPSGSSASGGRPRTNGSAAPAVTATLTAPAGGREADQRHAGRATVETSTAQAEPAGFSPWQRAVIGVSGSLVLADVVVLLIRR
jgi:ABC-type multidrug transport system ATPase subunit